MTDSKREERPTKVQANLRIPVPVIRVKARVRVTTTSRVTSNTVNLKASLATSEGPVVANLSALSPSNDRSVRPCYGAPVSICDSRQFHHKHMYNLHNVTKK